MPPKGAKKVASAEPVEQPAKRPRGRPKGAKDVKPPAKEDQIASSTNAEQSNAKSGDSNLKTGRSWSVSLERSGTSTQLDLEEDDEQATTPSGGRPNQTDSATTSTGQTDSSVSATVAGAEVTPAKTKKVRGRKAAAPDADASDPAPPAKKARKSKPEGPYTKYKGEPIPEPDLPRATAPDSTTCRQLKTIMWNIGGLRSFLKGRASVLTKLAEEEQPDLIALLEHRLQSEGKDTEDALKSLREALVEYDIAVVNYSTAKKGYSGVLLLIRKSIIADERLKSPEVTIEDLPSAAAEGRIVIADFEAVTVVTCYVPNAGDGLKRIDERIERWDVQLRERLAQLVKQKPVVLLGDLNVAHQDADIWNVEAPHVPKSAGTTPQERESFGRLLEDGFVDGFRHFHSDALGAFTYWSVRAGNRPTNRGLRLDYALVSKDMVGDSAGNHGAVKLHDAFHLPSFSTGDHCPVGATLMIPIEPASSKDAS